MEPTTAREQRELLLIAGAPEEAAGLARTAAAPAAAILREAHVRSHCGLPPVLIADEAGQALQDVLGRWVQTRRGDDPTESCRHRHFSSCEMVLQ